MNPKFSALRFQLPYEVMAFAGYQKEYKHPLKSTKVVITIPGGAGDTVLAIPVIKEIKKLCGEVLIYTNYPEVYSVFMPDEVHHSKTFPGYDYWINLIGLVMFRFGKNFSGFPKSVEDLYYSVNEKSKGEWRQVIYYHPFLDNFLHDLSEKYERNRENLPFYFLGLDTPPQELYLDIKQEPLPPNLGFMENEKFITIHNGFEKYTDKTFDRSTKNWHPKLFETFVRQFREIYPKIRVVQLGGPTGGSIDWVDYDFRKKLSFKESFQILSRSLCHVDGDSGLVHAARLMGVRSVVFWGPTKPEYYGHKENINVKGSGCEGGCFWLKPNWMEQCPIGYARPLCLDSISPKTILQKVIQVLGEA